MRSSLSWAAALGLWLTSTGYAAACEGAKVLFEDNFSGLKSEWGYNKDKPEADGGQLVLTPSAGKYVTFFASPSFQDIDYCATANLAESPNPKGSYAGIAFWIVDFKNLYTFQITLDGYATVYRLKADKWIQLIKDKPAASVKQGTHVANSLRVVTKGNRASFYINGSKFDTITGQAPTGGQHVGFVVEAPEGGPATFRLDDVNVTAPQ